MFAVWSRKTQHFRSLKTFSQWSGKLCLLLVNSVHSLTRWHISFAVIINGWWQAAMRLLVNSSDLSGEAVQLQNPVATVKRLWTQSEPLCMKRIQSRLSVWPNTPTHHVGEYLQKSAHCRCNCRSQHRCAVEVAGVHPKHTNPHTYRSVCLSPVFTKP